MVNIVLLHQFLRKQEVDFKCMQAFSSQQHVYWRVNVRTLGKDIVNCLSHVMFFADVPLKLCSNIEAFEKDDSVNFQLINPVSFARRLYCSSIFQIVSVIET